MDVDNPCQDGTACPSDELLQRCLAEEITLGQPQPTEEVQQTLLQVESCEWCQRRLDQLTSDDELRSVESSVPKYLHGFEQTLRSASLELPKLELPDYEVLEVLGHGGMGVVYRARHRKLDRMVALKILAPGTQASPGLRQRLEREGKIIAGLNHPSIIKCFDAGEFQGVPYLALEYIESGGLDDCRDDFRDPHDAVQLIGILAKAVHSTHQCGIVHRDIKPGNVLLSQVASTDTVAEDSCMTVHETLIQPKLTDFGLSKQFLHLGAADRSLYGAIGTPGYMSPEQATERNDQIGPPTDVHALGILLYELITQVRPFDGKNSLETLQNIRSTVPAIPSSVRSDIDPLLDAIVMKCLQKEPLDRYATALQLAEDAELYLQNKPLRYAVPNKTDRRFSRSRVMVSAGAIALGLVGWICFRTIEEPRTTVALDNRNAIQIDRSLESSGTAKSSETSKSTAITSDSITLSPAFVNYILNGLGRLYLHAPEGLDSGTTAGELTVLVARGGQTKEILARDVQMLRLPQGNREVPDFVIEEIANMSRLEVLHAQHTGFDDHNARSLPTIPSLRELDLYATRMSDRGLEGIVRQKNLIGLSLGDSKITAAGISRLSMLPLKWMNLQAPQFFPDDEMVRSVKNIKTLRYLNLVQCSDAELASVVQIPQLTSIGFLFCSFQSDPIEQLAKHSNISELQMQDIGFVDSSLANLSQLSKLEKLKIVAHGPKRVDLETIPLTNLKELHWSGVIDQDTDKSLDRIAKTHPSLKVLVNEELR